MEKVAKILAAMKSTPQDIRFTDLARVCEHYFGPPRSKGTSHVIYKTPWPGDPRVSIQKSKNGKAKAYQVRQVLTAIAKLEGKRDD